MGIEQIIRNLTGLFRWWVIVAPWEQAVRVRLGKHVRVLRAGIFWRIPGIDRVYRQSTRRRFTTVPTQTLTTKDGKALTVSGALAYAITDIGLLYDTLHDAEDVLQTEAAALVARFVWARDLVECRPEALERAVTDGIDLGRYGLSDTEYAVTDFAAVKTYRLIQAYPKDHGNGGQALKTDVEDGRP